MSKPNAGCIAVADDIESASSCVCLGFAVPLPLLCLLIEEPRLRMECSEIALRTLRTADWTEKSATRGPRVGRQAATMLREASMMLQYRVGRIRSDASLAASQHDTEDCNAGLQATSGSVWASV